MKQQDTQRLRKLQRQIQTRLEGIDRVDRGPVLSEDKITYEVGDRVRAIAHGGIGAAHSVVVKLGLIALINTTLSLLKVHRPYYESDHVLNIAYNILCGGRVLDDIERLRSDTVHLDALGVASIPDPTTAGDFCRRFADTDTEAMQDVFNDTRLKVWAQQGSAFTKQIARIDVDGSIVPTKGQCKEGIGLSYKGIWGYLGVLVSFANTGEPLFLRMMPGNASPTDVTPGYLDRAVTLVRRAGFKQVLLRGDTEFSHTQHLDRWDDDGVGFVFGYKAFANMKSHADAIDESEYSELTRRAMRVFVADDKKRAKQPRFKAQFVKERAYRTLRLKAEDIAEFDYSPTACKKSYRVVVVRKNISVERGEVALIDEIRYHFYITNQRKMSAIRVVFEAHDRCNQENLIAQLKGGGVRALHAPLNTLNANWAYRVMAALAWSIKAWMALSIPISPRWRKRHLAQRDRWLRMEFRTFLGCVINVPAQIIRTGRRRIFRLLAWRPDLTVLLRLHTT